jgi:hypothetical protein
VPRLCAATDRYQVSPVPVRHLLCPMYVLERECDPRSCGAWTTRAPPASRCTPTQSIGAAATGHAAALTASPENTLSSRLSKQIPSAMQIVSHTHAQPGFKVGLPLRIIRIGLALDFSPTATLLEHALLTQGFMGGSKAGFLHSLQPQNRDSTRANLANTQK